LKTVRTDRQGRYAFNDLRPGTYRVGAGEGSTYEWRERTVTLTSDLVVNLTLPLERATAWWRRR